MSEVTQVANSWRTTVRTGFQVGLALVSILPVLLLTSGLSATVVGAQLIAVSAVVAKVMALPQVNAFIERFVPWLAAEPVQVTAKHRPKPAGGVGESA